MHVTNHHSFVTRLISKECMTEYLQVCEVTSGRRACQTNVKHLTRKNEELDTAYSCILMQLSILFCFCGSFLRTRKSTWIILEITFAMLAVFTATINNKNYDDIFQWRGILLPRSM